jgi:hypothetical protein
MHSPTLALRVAAVLFSLFCIGHVARLIGHVNVMVEEYTVPSWLSIVAAAIGAVLATWMWLLARPTRPSSASPGHSTA